MISLVYTKVGLQLGTIDGVLACPRKQIVVQVFSCFPNQVQSTTEGIIGLSRQCPLRSTALLPIQLFILKYRMRSISSTFSRP